MTRSHLSGLALVAGSAAVVAGFGVQLPGPSQASAQTQATAQKKSGSPPPASVQPAAADAANTPPTDAAAEACADKAYGAIGVPKVLGSDNSEKLICRAGYAVSFNLRTRDPDWVIEHVPGSQVVRSAQRSNAFQADPLLGDNGSQLADYSGSGFDRGHQAPAGDFKSSQSLMNDSFYLSNMAPQVGIGFNRGEWAYLEGTVRSWLTCGHVSDVYIITGPIYGGSAKTIGADHVAVPSSFYKIVYDPTNQRAIGFVLPNQKLPRQDVANFIQPITSIEDQTGLLFFSALTQRDQNLMKSNKAVMWPVDERCAGADPES